VQHPDASERSTQFASMFDVLVVLVAPKTCQHTLMEQYFANPKLTIQYVPCSSMCDYCSRASVLLTGMIYHERLSELLISFCTGKEQLTNSLVEFINSKKKIISHKNHVPSKLMGPIHATCLQLIAMRILELGIIDNKKLLVGKKGLMPQNVIILLGTDNGQPRVLRDEYWEHICVAN
jgi:hypothetical protein